ncbi:uncharacterized protein [Typha angustifolia]|uniref:uncharacterized protein isoform X2 n=1 Tax=Typha angustifolia TaxID=59011 RepID=UPI003C2CDDE0
MSPPPLLLNSPPLPRLIPSPLFSAPSSYSFPSFQSPIPLLRCRRPRPRPRPRRRCFLSSALPAADHHLLQALVSSSGNSHLPAVRSYEGDLSCLTLTGAVSFDQALTAAAADGGSAAEEHLSSGVSTMVVETVFPGSPDEHSTVSTRLFLPAKNVKEKAKQLRNTFSADFLSENSTMSKNILAMTFRQVVLENLWSFRLVLFCPGTKRDMNDLAKPREAVTKFSVSSSNERFLSSLAEAVCSCVIENTQKFHLGKLGGLASNNVFGWFQKPQSICSADSSIFITRLTEGEIVKNAKKQMQNFNLLQGNSSEGDRKLKHRWWPPPNSKRLEKLGGPGFVDWTNEFIPAYRLQIDANIYNDAKLEGWQEVNENRWEVLLTHFQMVELGNILDMYYEDRYTLPEKQLSCGLISESLNITKNNSSLLKTIFAIVAGGCIVVLVGIVAQVCWPNLLKDKKASEGNTFVSSSESYCCHLHSIDAVELEAFCISVVKKIQDALGWPGEITADANIGAWIGVLPGYLKNKNLVVHSASGDREEDNSSSGENIIHAELPTSTASHLITDNSDTQTDLLDIASFQVVLSGDGKIVGFQPTSRTAVNHWGSNPLAKILYDGQKLSPGLLEPKLNIPLPSGVILIELLMSVKPESSFALARPVQQIH